MASERLTAVGNRALDFGLVLGVAILAGADLVALGPEYRTQAALRLLLDGTVMVAVLVRRRVPLASFLVVAAAAAASSIRSGVLPETSFGTYPSVAAIAALAALVAPVVRRRPPPIAAGAATVGAFSLAPVLTWGGFQGDLVFFTILFAGTYVIGLGTGVYLRELDRRQEASAEAARLDERRDLARELHDLVAHHVTGIVVAAQAARVVADHDPEAAGTALERIEGAGRDALSAMRRLVGSLRDEGGAAPLAPPPGLSGLDDLVREVTSTGAGPAVELTVDPAARTHLPGAVAASAHRIVQEALTNVRRHAAGATRAAVDVRLDRGTLLVTVTDDGHQPVGGARPDRGGFGLIGMRERSAALGGHLHAGPLDPPAEGWRVQARLPLYAPVREPLR